MDDEQPGRRQQFITGIAAGIAYFQALAAQGDEGLAALDAERHNLHQVVQYGLAFPETWPATATLIDQTFPIIERRGYWQEWIPIIQMAIDRSPDDNLCQKIKLLNRLGQLYRYSHQLADAIATHLKAEAHALELNDELLVARIRFSLTGDYLSNKQYAEAECYGLMALISLQEQKEETKLLGNTLRILGQTARELGHLDVAIDRTEAAIKIWRLLDDPTELARSLNDLANIYLANEKFDQAAQFYKGALDLLQSSVSDLDKTLIHTNLGALYFRKKLLAEAESAFRQADTPFLRRSPQYYYQALVANGLGNVLLEQRRLDEAASYLVEAIKLWRVTGDQVNLANTLGALGEVHTIRGEEKEALSLYNEAILLLERYPDSDWARRFLNQIKTRQKKLIDKE